MENKIILIADIVVALILIISLFSKNKTLFGILYVFAGLGLVIILLTCLTPDDEIENEVVKQKCKDNHICYELVETIADYTEKDENEIYDFFYMISDDEMDLYDAVKLVDSSLTDKEIEIILDRSAERERANENSNN